MYLRCTFLRLSRRRVAHLQFLDVVAELVDRLLGKLQSVLELDELVLHFGLGVQNGLERLLLLLFNCKTDCEFQRGSRARTTYSQYRV